MVAALLVDPQNPSILYAGSDADGMFKSTNGGAGWSSINTGMRGFEISTLEPGPSAPVLYAGTPTGGVFKTSNAGASWVGGMDLQSVTPFVQALAVHPTTPAIVYAGAAGAGMLKSLNHGIDWTGVNTGLTNQLVFRIAIDPAEPEKLYACTEGGVFMSRNGGRSWTPLLQGLTNTIVTALAIDKRNHKIVYAGTEGGGVFRYVHP
jgi:photosystem II stability/assembly factor-like uncharacterized protein